MKHRYSYLLLLSLLFSCSGKTAEFKDQRKALSSLPKIDESLTQELKDKCLANDFSTDNGLYSPIGSKLIDQYANDDDGFNTLYALMNVEMEHLLLKDTFATAATPGNTDEGKFRDSVATFEGTKDELNKAIRDYFKVNMDTIYDPGLYYFSYFEFKDAFPEACSEKKGLSFNGKGSYDYVSYYDQGKYYEDDDFVMAELSLSKTTFRVLMPKEGKTVDSSKIFTQKMNSGLIDVRIPKFEINSDDSKFIQNGNAERQINQFRFDKEGVYGTSFTYSGPTSTETPSKIAFDFTFDKTFLFASMSEDIPLFYGQVASLK